jgi:Amt family ammonium transporter
MGGLWGVIATGIFACAQVNSFTGLIYGNVHQFTVQIMAAGASVIYAFVMTLILARIVDSVMGLRVTEEEEYVGLDIAQHGEKAYA